MDTRFDDQTSRRRLAAALALVAGLLAGCGSTGQATDSQTVTPSTDMPTIQSPSTPSSSQSGTPMPTGPACGSVWKAGAKLPATYKGCVQGAAWVAADNLGCSSGQKLVRFDDHFWAVRHGTIHRVTSLKTDKDYQRSVASCRA